MNVNNKLSSNPLTVANVFNSYFLSVAENFITKNLSEKKYPVTYLGQTFGHISSQMKLTNTTVQEIN